MAITLNAPGQTFSDVFLKMEQSHGVRADTNRKMAELQEWMSTTQKELRHKTAKTEILLKDTMLENPELVEKLQVTGMGKEIADNIASMDTRKKDLLISATGPVVAAKDPKQANQLYKQSYAMIREVDPDAPTPEEFAANQKEYLPLLKISYSMAHEDRTSRQAEDMTRLNHLFNKKELSDKQRYTQANIVLQGEIDRQNAIDLERFKSALSASMGTDISDLDKELLKNSLKVWESFQSAKGAQEVASFTMPIIQMTLRSNGLETLDEDKALTESWLAGYSGDLQQRASTYSDKYRQEVGSGARQPFEIPSPQTVLQHLISEDIKNGRFRDGKFLSAKAAEAAKAAEEAVRREGAQPGGSPGERRAGGWRDALREEKNKAQPSTTSRGLAAVGSAMAGVALKERESRLSPTAQKYQKVVDIEANIIKGLDRIIETIEPSSMSTDEWGISTTEKRQYSPEQQLKVDQLNTMKSFITDLVSSIAPSIVEGTAGPGMNANEITERQLRMVLKEGLKGKVNKTLLEYL